MRRGVLAGLGLVLLAAAAVVGWRLSDGETQAQSQTPGASSRSARAPSRGHELTHKSPTPPPSGALSIHGWVRTEQGPAEGVRVVATRPMPGETLSELPCPESSLAFAGRRGATLANCLNEAEGLVMELVRARYGEAPEYATATTAADGSFVLQSLPEGTFTLWAMDARGARRKQDVPAGAEGVGLLLAEGQWMAGVVRDEEGVPVPEVRVTVVHEAHTRFFDTVTGEDGRFRVGPLPGDSYALVVEKEGWLPVFLRSGGLEWSKGQVVLLRARRLTGRVLSDGAAAPGAELLLGGQESRGIEALRATADAEGRFTFEGLEPESYRLTAESHARHAVAQVDLSGQLREPEEVVLELGSALFAEGTVRDEAGRVVEGVSVSLRVEEEYGQPWTAVTDAAGQYRVGPLQAGAYSFGLSAEGYLDEDSLTRELTRDSAPVDFTLKAAARISGVLVDEAGQPVPHIRVFLKERRKGPDDFSLITDGNAADAEGRFSLDAPHEGAWVLDVSDEGFLQQEVSVQAPSEGVRMVLSRGATVAGTVTDARGQAVERASVTLWRLEPEEGPERSRQTGEEGRFTLQGVRPGRYMVEATLETPGVDLAVAKAIEVRGAEQAEVALRFEEGRTVSGLAVDGEGQPVEGVSVRVNLEDEHVPTWRRGGRTCGNRLTLDARTDAQGRFTLRHLGEETYWLYAHKSGHTFMPALSVGGERVDDYGLRVSEATKELRLVFDRQARVHGRLVGPDGAPLRHFNLNQEPVSDAEGYFELPISDAGQLRLEFTATGMAPLIRDVQVQLGVDKDLGAVRMGPGRRVTGRVVDLETGAPVAKVRLEVAEASSSMDTFNVEGLMAVTREDGTFELPRVEARPLLLVVSHEGYLPLSLPLGANQESVTVTVDPGARLEVTMKDAQGRPMNGFINLASEDSGSVSAQVKEGRLIRRGVPEGLYMARAHASEPAGAGIFLPRSVRIPARGLVVLDFAERKEGATLKVDLGEGGELMDGLLLPGGLPGPLNLDDLPTLRERSLPAEQEGNVVTFQYLPTGHATVLLLMFGAPGRVYREELELPPTGVVERKANWQPVGEL
ncbi:carboxypeptidase regulatory-like domain-containing protein [Hyalangium rubrum]|uniref:Carboxypeptidase regulatory-like domain-containing protein n=1 Tax=Hyalangium rubrum TaxID=3103134 RepID=A0ABU5HD98_9BACT|nr:carboxypeptidase regulatory-like domain-containing protein [Hyalangium sp. s54d21]MDY7231443.1 carboxypeptidase regulatory-like domain-containing protein [Hyalangium sp. s54d21]